MDIISHLGSQRECEHELTGWLKEPNCGDRLRLPESCDSEYRPVRRPHHPPVHEPRSDDGCLLIAARVHQDDLPVSEIERQPHIAGIPSFIGVCTSLQVTLAASQTCQTRPHFSHCLSLSRCCCLSSAMTAFRGGRAGRGFWHLNPLQTNDANPGKYLSGRYEHASVYCVQFDQLADAAPYDDARVIGTPS